MISAFLDHLILGANDLDAGIAFVERRTGVRAALGGIHAGRGTRNALLSLGHSSYLEIMAPDPQQETLTWFTMLPQLAEPRLVGWMAHPGEPTGNMPNPGSTCSLLVLLAQQLREQGIGCDGPHLSSRSRPDGRTLRWELLYLADNHGGLLPTFIEWGSDTPHPSSDAPSGITLVRFFAASPEPDDLQLTYDRLGVSIPVEGRERQQLRAQIRGPRGVIDLTS